MRRLFETENPWEEDAQDRSRAAIATVFNARRKTQDLKNDLPALAKDLSVFADNLEIVERAYRRDPGAYRRTRALTAVHLPSILASLEALAGLRANAADQERLDLVETDLKACLQAAAEARKTIESASATGLEVEAAVLREAVAPQEKPQDLAEHSRWHLLPALTGALGKGCDHLNQHIKAGQAQIRAAGGEASLRLGAGTGAATTYLSGLLEDGVDRLTAPIARHAKATQDALTTASLTAVIDGVIMAIIFPPAVPFALGLALLESGSSYMGSLETQTQKDAARRFQRRSRRKKEVREQLDRFRGKSPVVRMETPHIHVTINAATGEAEGIILSGALAGASLAGIAPARLRLLARTAPDDETRKILESWRQRA